MKKYALTPRTLAVYEEFVATDRKFSKGDGTYDGLKIWCVMEQLKSHMTTRTPTPRTDAAWKAVSSDPYIDEMFGMDVLAETMESMELEIISLKARLDYYQKRAETAENALIDLKLFGKK
jgi:hypothetical protein